MLSLLEMEYIKEIFLGLFIIANGKMESGFLDRVITKKQKNHAM